MLNANATKNKFIIQSVVSRDIDHMGELVRPWNVHLRKLNKGNDFIGKVDSLVAKDFIIIKTDFSSVLEQVGAPPEGMRTIWIPVDDAQHFYWRNNTITGNTLGFFPLGAELDATSKPGFRVYVISIPEEQFISHAYKLGLDWTHIEKSNFKDHKELPIDKIDLIRNHICKLFDLKKCFINTSLNHAFDNLKDSLVDLLILNTLHHIKRSKPNRSNRLRVFKNFKDYIYANPFMSYNSSELCTFVGASERTLQYTLKDYTGLSPAQFYKGLKLSLLRERLKISDPINTKINQLAHEFGFWHTAQLAVDYRNQFGELPSETLKRLF